MESPEDLKAVAKALAELLRRYELHITEKGYGSHMDRHAKDHKDVGGCLDRIPTGVGGSAPTGASYVTMAAEAGLTSERRVAAGTGIAITDAGANSTVTVAVDVGIADDKILQVDDATAADNDYAKFTAAGLEGRTYAEVKQDLDLEDADIKALAVTGVEAEATLDLAGDLQVTKSVPYIYLTDTSEADPSGRFRFRDVAGVLSLQYKTVAGSPGTWAIIYTGDPDGLHVNTFNITQTATESISSGTLTLDTSYVMAQVESGDADDIDNFAGGGTGTLYIVQNKITGKTITIKHDTGNIHCHGEADIVLDTVGDWCWVLKNGVTYFAFGAGGSGSVATDTIWAAAGDLAVGTGNDTAGVLTKGTDAQVLTMVAGAVAWAAAAGGGAMATDPLWDAKGDLAGGTGANTGAKLTVGANDTMLMAASGETTGLKWGNAATVKAALDLEDADITTLAKTVKLDALTAPDDNTTLDASTSKHGLALKATAPAAGLYNYIGITNAETAYTNKALFDATVPGTIAESAAAAAGTAAVAARRDHTHGAPATYAPTAHNVFSASHGDSTGAANPVDGDIIIGNATPKWSKLAISIPGGAGLLNVLGIVTGELRSSWKALFDATHPEPIGTATEGTATTAAHRDHVHAADSDDVAYISTTAADWDGAADPGDVEQALDQLAERQRNAFVFIPASVMWPSTGTGALLDGCAWPARREFTTNGVNLYYCAFDTTTSEAAEFSVVLPVWDGGTVTATVHFTTVLDTGADKTVNWEVQAQSYDTLEAIDTAWGTSQTAAATVPDNKQDTVIEVACDTAITVATTPSYLNLVHFRIYRDVANDNLAADADLLGVTIGYNRRDA